MNDMRELAPLSLEGVCSVQGPGTNSYMYKSLRLKIQLRYVTLLGRKAIWGRAEHMWILGDGPEGYTCTRTLLTSGENGYCIICTLFV